MLFKYSSKVEMAKLRSPLFENNTRVKELFRVYVNESVLNQDAPISLILHILFVGLSFWSPIAHTFHPFMIIFLNQTTKYLIRSVTEHLKQLGVTFMMSIIIIYVYAMINAIYYRDIFDNLSSNGIDLCRTLYSCLFYVVDFGLRSGGGVADTQGALPFTLPSSLDKMSFNLGFFTLINIIALNIVFGIIIDSFAELRDNATERSKIFVILVIKKPLFFQGFFTFFTKKLLTPFP